MGSFKAWIVLLLGAGMLGVLAARYMRKELRSQDSWGDESFEQADVTSAVDRWARPAGPSGRSDDLPRQAGLSAWKGLFGQEQPDQVFKHRTGSRRVLFDQVHSAVSSGHVKLRDLNRREGSFLFDDEKGWMRFNGSRFAPVDERELPEELRGSVTHATADLTDRTGDSEPGDP